MRQMINREMEFIGGGGCSCSVPTDLHGTCCGWINASVTVSSEFVILDKRHPGFGQNLNTWKQNALSNARRNYLS